MKQALFFSGGKDSFWCLQAIEGPVELITTIGEESGRVPIQGIRSEVIQGQAAALDLPLQLIELPEASDNRTYVERVSARVLAQGYERLYFGDLFLEDIRDFRRRAFSNLDAELLFPIWGRDTSELAREMIDAGLVAYVCSINPSAVVEAVLGHRYDRQLLDALPEGVDPCGENGEFHTLVLGPADGPQIKVEAVGVFDHLGHRVMDYSLD